MVRNCDFAHNNKVSEGYAITVVPTPEAFVQISNNIKKHIKPSNHNLKPWAQPSSNDAAKQHTW